MYLGKKMCVSGYMAKKSELVGRSEIFFYLKILSLFLKLRQINKAKTHFLSLITIKFLNIQISFKEIENNIKKTVKKKEKKKFFSFLFLI